MSQTLQETVTIICGECGCKRAIKDQEVPVGDCRFCKKGFGYYIYPDEIYQKAFHPKRGEEAFALKYGDILTLNTRVKAENSSRIVIIERDGVVIYRDRNYVG